MFWGGETTVDLSAADGRFAVEWYRTEDGKIQQGGDITGGKSMTFVPPWPERDVLLRLVRK